MMIIHATGATFFFFADFSSLAPVPCIAKTFYFNHLPGLKTIIKLPVGVFYIHKNANKVITAKLTKWIFLKTINSA